MPEALEYLTAAMLLSLAAPVTATPTRPTPHQDVDQAALERVRAYLEQARAVMLRPGERVEGWDRGGARPDEDIRALGVDSHYFLHISDMGTGVAIVTDRPISELAPQPWRVVDSYGTAGETLERPEIEVRHITARYAMALRSEGWRQNDASCFRSVSHALLFDLPGAPSSPDDEMAPIMFRMIILAFEGQTICMRFDGDRLHGWRIRYFLPDGRLLPELTRPTDLLTIVPAAPVDELIAPPPATATPSIH